jgi:putative NADPH-quinone reductase
MKTVINLFHPHFGQSRVNKALINAVGDTAEVRNLYQLYPDFKIDVAAEHAALEGADRIVLEYPMYWYSTPALLKQWEDDVLTYGWAYGSDGNALQGKELLVAVTVGADNYGRKGFAKYEVNELLRPLQATSRLIGTKFIKPFKVMGASTISDEGLQQAAHDYCQYLQEADLPVLGDFE